MIPSNELTHLVTEEDIRKGKIIVIDKPEHWTSFDVVNVIRKILKKKFGQKNLKVGHAGTLDPLATGVLVIGIGPATKMLHKLQADEKAYEGTIMLGAITPSYDRETEPEEYLLFDHVTEKDIRDAMQSFIGRIDQYPPLYSAVKVKGKKLYERARKNEKINIKPRRVNIYAFKPLNIDIPKIDFYARVSKGTYIRSLAYDLGKKLNTGAYLYDLKRVRSGKYSLEDAVSLEEWIQINKLSGE